MKRYLSTLHERPESHRKRFALFVSSSLTLLIFALWSLATFGPESAVANNSAGAANATKEVSPLQSLGEDISSVFRGFSESFNDAKEVFDDSVDLQTGYDDMKSGVLNTYGQ